VTKRKISVVLICSVLIGVLIVRGQFVEGRNIQRENDTQSVSLSEQEIAEEANKRFRSSFLENQGQIGNDEIIFYGSLTNGKIAFGESKVMLWMEGMNSIVSLNFVGARRVSPIGLDELVTKSNYFLGDRGTYTNVRSFGAILFKDLWKGIDLYYQATPKGAKYEFRVAPGANPEDISINCEGQEQLIIRKNSLTILKGNGQFVDEGLKVYQEDVEIDARFVSKGSNIFGFQISSYDKFKSLIIDPLIYSTFVGGSDDDESFAIALDNEGCVYVTGNTESISFPTTEEAYNETYGGGSLGDCFVFKLSADGSSLLYSTFVGGNESDYGRSIALDNDRNVFVTGNTYSTNFPTTEGAYNRTRGEGYDCFVFKLSANGSILINSTFVGGSRSDYGYSITLDNQGNSYVTGITKSTNFPTTANAFDETYNVGGLQELDCFVFKLAANGSTLLFSTYIGASDSEWACSIALDSVGNAYVTGLTYSDDFPTTPGAFDETAKHLDQCFVFKLSADGSTLLYSTVVGGSSRGNSIAVDDEGNAYVTGSTSSSNFPTSEGAYNRTHSGFGDCFVIKLSTGGSTLLYSTFVGQGRGNSITLDNEGNAYVTGNVWSTNFPTTSNAYNRTYSGVTDCSVFKLSANGSSLLYSTIVGGSSIELDNFIVIDNDRNAYVTGNTESSNFPTTINAFDESYNGGFDGDCYVFKLPIEDAPPPSSTLTSTTEGGLTIWLITPLSFVIIGFIIYRRKKIG